MDNRDLMQNALQQLRDLRSKLKAVNDAKTEAIAIVGMGCRFPGGVDSPEALWELLRNGIDGITEIPNNRWDIEKYYHPEPGIPGKMYTRYGGFVEHLEEFDAEFFGIAPREAISLDPQQRLLLEVAWEALENAGMIPEQLTGSLTGVFIGISSNDYSTHLLNRPVTDIDAYLATGNSHSTAAGRLSYTLGLTGPSFAVDTACSSSLVAVHLACQSLRNRECDIALVGGVNRIFSPEFTINFSQARMLAADGHCKTFDAAADGFVRSEGCGIIVLQRLSDAASKRILAVIKGSAVNQDGRSGGLTVPNGPSQQAVIRQALTNACLNPADISYIEAHGTGTSLGDPIEVNALGAVFEQPLLVGSLKTNIGHLEAAAGIAGLIKVVLALQHQEIPPHLHFSQPNPHIDWENLPISISTVATPWNSVNRFAGVSSFGFSGTNAHVILGEAPAIPTPESASSGERPLHLLTLSAKTPTALQQLARRFADYFSQQRKRDISWGDVCFSANTGRSLFEHRLALIADSVENACIELNNFADGKTTKAVISQVNQVGESSILEKNLPDLSMPIEKHDYQVILTNLAELYGQKVKIDWQRFYAGHQHQFVELPNYPFQRQRFWVDVNVTRSLTNPKPNIHPLLGQQLHLAKCQSLYYEQQSNNYPGYIQDHRVFTQIIIPGAAYIEMALAAGKQIFGCSIRLSDVSFLQSAITSDSPKVIQFILTNKEKFEIVSATVSQIPSENAWTTHATGKVSMIGEDINIQPGETFNFVEKQSQYNQITDIADFYENLRTVGIDYGVSFQAITQLWYGENQALAEINLPQVDDQSSNYQFHPIILDACLQTIAAIFYRQPETSVYLPIGLDSFEVWESVGEKVWSWVKLRHDETTSIIVADMQIFNLEGKAIAYLNGLQLKAVKSQPSLTLKPNWQEWLYEVEWRNQTIQLKEEFSLFSPEIIAQRLAPKFTELLTQREIQTYAELLPQLETLSVAYVVETLRKLGLSLQVGEKFSQQEFIKEAAIVRSHQQLCIYLFEMLSSAGILQRRDDIWYVKQCPNFGLAQQQLQLQAKYALAMTELKLLQRCADHLAEVLQGRCEPLQILFPNGDLTSLSQLYHDSPGAKVMNTLVQQAVITALETLPPAKTIRILEIGGGTGGTTANLLPQLANYSVEYIFTDISPLFLAKARQQFCDYNFVSYQSLNIEQSISSQGFTTNSFDIIIAANVLHATQDLSQTIGNVKSLLTDNGLLILLEGTRPSGWLDLIFGLTEGWWCFQDKDLRPLHPLISAQQWQTLLQVNGFNCVKVISPDCELPKALAQQAVIVAQLKPQIEPWLIVTENQEMAQAIISNKPRENYHLTNKENICEFLQQIPNKPLKHVIYIGNSHPESNLPQHAYEECTHLLNLVQALIQQQHYPTNLWIVTQGAVHSTPTTTGLGQSPLWGMGKVIRLEHPELNCRCVDLEPTIALQQIDSLLAELTNPNAEDQISLHATKRQVARLTRAADQMTIPDEPYRLTITQRGSLDSLQWQTTTRRQPQAGEVEIRVRATGLNFIDILDSLGMLPFERNWFGVECAGEIVAVGEDVAFAVGDAVVALAADSFSQYITTDANLVVAKPDLFSFETAASIPANFITAEYALHEVAKIQPGERILIHAAASGTGMAALQIAQKAGLEVFATASPGKWEKLRALGVQHIFNSRTLDFTTQILEATNGKGVDIVFNSLSGEFISASLSVLQSQGRFIEIGKRGIWNAQEVFQVKPDVDYYLVDLMTVAEQTPIIVRSLLSRLMVKFTLGELQPLPQTTFTTENVIKAFRMMQQAQHTGKVVITHQANPSPNFSPKRREALNSVELGLIHPEATYLITGGMGGLGLEVARWLAEKGAKYLVLVGRTIPTTAATQIQALKAAGVSVTTVAADVVELGQLEEIFATIEANYPPLRGVIHGAGVLDDGVLQQLNSERLEKVMAAKVAGAWNLHTLTKNTPLDYFIMFSSAASLLGSPGQANHVAANTFLDALAKYRHSQNLPALSINWGAWSDIGAAAKRQVGDIMIRGIGAIAPDEGIEILEYLLTQPTTQVGVIPINWSELLTQKRDSNFFADFHTQSLPTHQTSPLMQQLTSLGVNERQIMLTSYLQSEVSKVLGLPADQLPDTQIGFFDMGMDSLMMVELRSQVERSLEKTIAATLLFEHPNIQSLAEYIATEILPINTNIESVDMMSPASCEDVEDAIALELAALEAILGSD